MTPRWSYVCAALLRSCNLFTPAAFTTFLEHHRPLRPAVHSYLFSSIRIKFEPKFGGDHNLIAERSEGFAHQFFVCEWTVTLSRIEECDTAFDCGTN
jgi:hypothetical protein